MARLGGSRRKKAGIMTKSTRTKGKMPLQKFLQEFSQGDKVVLRLEPSVQGGMYLPRFHGKSAIVSGRQGECYRVIVRDGNKEKTLVVHPVHLVKQV